MTYLMDRCLHKAKPTNGRLYITESIVFEILSWVPAQDLVRYKAVCKQWRSLIDDPNFIDLHKSRARRSVIGAAKLPNSSMRLLPPDGGGIFLSSIRHGRILGSSTCGLVCVETGNNKYHIRNPVTGKSLQLPPLKRNSSAVEMRVYPNPQSRQFSVAAVCKHSPATPKRTYYWAFFTIGVDSDWRCLEHPMGADVDGQVMWWSAVLCESAPFCLFRHGHTLWGWIQTLRLDPHTGQVITIVAPFNVLDDRHLLLHGHEWDGKFSISIGGKSITSWFLEEDDTFYYVWRLTRTDLGPWNRGMMLVCFVQQGKMWLRSKQRRRDFFSLDLFAKRMDKISFNGKGIYDIETYTSTLESLEEML